MPTDFPSPSLFQELNSKLRRPTIPSLNGLRALAILLVVLVHAKVTRQTGVLGVEGFFVLSGFLITWKLFEEDEASGHVSTSQFYFGRMLRIFPAFYGFWLVAVGQILIRHGRVPWKDAMAAFFYVSNYYHGLRTAAEPFMLHTWSLSVEEQFYLLWPTLFVHLKNLLRQLTLVLVLIVACVWVYRAAFSLTGSDQMNWYIFTAFEMRVDQLAIGCLLAVAIKRKVLVRFWELACYNEYVPLLPVLLLVVSEQFVGNVRYRNAFSFITDPLLCAILLIQMVWFSASRLWGWLNHPVLNWIGKLSYSIYLYHELALALGHRLTANAPQLSLPAGVLLTLILSSASHYVIEKPFLRLKRNLGPKLVGAPIEVGQKA